MTKKEYAEYLSSLIDEELDVNIEFLADQLYAYFQCFMPYGKNVEKIFEPIPNGQIFYERIKPIFTETEKEVLEVFDQNASPGYFVPSKKSDNEQLKEFGKELLENLIIFSEFIQDEELIRNLKEISIIEISNSSKQDFENDVHQCLYEVFSDWTIENSDEEELISILDEAYYSISNDYFLSAYLQYPKFKNKPELDFLKPYFELWKRGYNFVLNDKKLILF
ncbi:hypothetical protein [Myroides injenensis]|uniref:hypothetical protein n=1 Tax=Myroides injenensis TaxID=1183151 RepID=UPI0022710F48|nr:hypothetical protein [Myroides injenensis]